MTENLKRSLRTRKTPTYRQSQILDSNPFGYINPDNIKDCVSPALQLNYSAKILTKYIHQINKNLKEHNAKEGEDEHQKMIPEPVQHPKYKQKVTNYNQTTKKATSYRKNNSEDGFNKQKELYKFKNQHEHPQMMGSLIKNEGPQKLKTTHKNTSRSIINPYSSFFNQFSQQRPSSELNSMMPQIDPNNTQLVQRLLAEQQQLIQSQFFKEKNKFLLNQDKESKDKNKKSKLFGRSAYHIAIAYHIHLQNVKQKHDKETDIFLLDPTYYSKRLKQQSKEPFDPK